MADVTSTHNTGGEEVCTQVSRKIVI